MNNGKIKYIVALHPLQEKLMELFANEEIQYNTSRKKEQNTLREMGIKMGIGATPQQVKHHLIQLVRYGFVDVVGGSYKINKKYLPK